MRKKYLLILSFSSTLLFANTDLTSIYRVKSYVGKTKPKELIDSVREIVYAGTPNRFFGTSGHKNVQNLIEKKLRLFDKMKNVSLEVDLYNIDVDEGVKNFEQDFSKKIKPLFKPKSEEYKKWFSFKEYMKDLIKSKKEIEAKNFILTIKGKSSNTLTLTTHYDTVVHDAKTMKVDEKSKMPGADFNASSVAVMFKLIEKIAPYELKNTLRFVFLDAQSLGFLGSYHFAKKLDSNEVGVINLEMLGYDSKSNDENKRLRNFKAYTRDKRQDPKGLDKNLYDKINQYVKKSGTSMRFSLDQNNFDHSDNVRFGKIANMTLSQNWEEDFNPNFQTSDDFPETLNQQSLLNSYQYIGIGILGYGLDL